MLLNEDKIQEMLIPCIVYWKFYDMKVHFQILFWLISDWMRTNTHHVLTDNALNGYIASILEIKTTPDKMKVTLFFI